MLWSERKTKRWFGLTEIVFFSLALCVGEGLNVQNNVWVSKQQHTNKLTDGHSFQVVRIKLSLQALMVKGLSLRWTEHNSCANKSSQPLPHIDMPELKRKKPWRNVALMPVYCTSKPIEYLVELVDFCSNPLRTAGVTVVHRNVVPLSSDGLLHSQIHFNFLLSVVSLHYITFSRFFININMFNKSTYLSTYCIC